MNGVYPIAITVNPYSIHGNAFSGSRVVTSHHDINHYMMYITRPIESYNIIETFYRYIMENVENIGEVKVKIFGIFNMLHESDIPQDFPYTKKYINYCVLSDEDSSSFFKINSYYY